MQDTNLVDFGELLRTFETFRNKSELLSITRFKPY